MIRFWKNLTNGIWNIWKWIPIIWDDHDWDWYYIARVLEFKLQKHAAYAENYGSSLSSKRDAQQMRICATLLNRLIEDNYWSNAKIRFGNSKKAMDAADVQYKADLKYLGDLLGKYLIYWWD